MKRKRLLSILLAAAAVFAVIVLLLLSNANRILKHELERFLGKGFTVGTIALRWGGVEAERISLKRPDAKEAFGAEAVRVRADFIGLLTRKNVISGIALEKPHLFLEVSRSGEVVFPAMGRESGSKDRARGRKEEKATPYVVKKFKIESGKAEYLDRKAGPQPALIRFADVDLDMDDLSAPLSDMESKYDLSSTVLGKNGNGRLKAHGTVNLKTLDTRTRLLVKGLDITELKPYYQKSGDVDVTKGFLSVDSKILIVKSKINASGTIVIKDLEFRSDRGTFLGVPLAAVTGLLKDSSNAISLDFTIEGDLKNPKFNIRDSLVQKLALSLAKSLGLPIQEIGKSVFDLGGSAIRSIFK
ncbi:MAG: hypothetical protein OHK006_08040 [Thermodesulfovibrionales bacterium]